MKKQKYYAVIIGRVKTPTIFKNWDECKKSIDKFPNAKYKSFDSKEDAQNYIMKEKSKGRDISEKLSLNQKLDVFREIRKKKEGSIGEDVIEMCLKIYKFDYKKEYPVNIEGIEYRFDFAIYYKEKLVGFIEFDGIQHFEPVADFGGTDGLLKTQDRDLIKNNYCKKKTR